MEWTVSDLNKRVKSYNRIYFDNEIELPVVVKLSRHLFNSGSNTYAYSSTRGNTHEIVVSIKLLNASSEMIRSVLVHELVHAWQDEHDPKANDNFKELQGHGPAFMKKCEELNSKFKFRYPIQRYMDDRRIQSVERSSGNIYYVYKMINSKVEPSVEYPIGVFVKFLYKNEIDRLKRHGLSVKYYKNAVYSDTTEWKPDRNKRVSESDNFVTYNMIKDCTADTLIKHILDKLNKYCIATDDDFNYQDGIEVD